MKFSLILTLIAAGFIAMAATAVGHFSTSCCCVHH